MSERPLSADFFERPTVEVARALLGCVLEVESAAGCAAGRVVETEAYLSADDEASHSARGRTARNASMFAAPGTAYVYQIYGVHLCLNVVTAPVGVGEAVLFRALEPLEGLELMAARRGRSAPRELCSGPGKLVQALGVSRELDGCAFGAAGLKLFEGAEAREVEVGPRIGLTKGKELPLRFCVRESSWLSR